MFQRLENIFNAIKGFFGFFESIITYIKMGFQLLSQFMNFVFDFYDDWSYLFPPYMVWAVTIVLFVWIIRTITGRLNNK